MEVPAPADMSARVVPRSGQELHESLEDYMKPEFKGDTKEWWLHVTHDLRHLTPNDFLTSDKHNGILAEDSMIYSIW